MSDCRASPSPERHRTINSVTGVFLQAQFPGVEKAGTDCAEHIVRISAESISRDQSGRVRRRRDSAEILPGVNGSNLHFSPVKGIPFPLIADRMVRSA